MWHCIRGVCEMRTVRSAGGASFAHIGVTGQPETLPDSSKSGSEADTLLCCAAAGRLSCLHQKRMVVHAIMIGQVWDEPLCRPAPDKRT